DHPGRLDRSARCGNPASLLDFGAVGGLAWRRPSTAAGVASMPPLHDLITALAGRPDASGALVVSDEGLVIDAALPVGVEAEAIAAHAATAFRSLLGLTT